MLGMDDMGEGKITVKTIIFVRRVVLFYLGSDIIVQVLFCCYLNAILWTGLSVCFVLK